MVAEMSGVGNVGPEGWKWDLLYREWKEMEI